MGVEDVGYVFFWGRRSPEPKTLNPKPCTELAVLAAHGVEVLGGGSRSQELQKYQEKAPADDHKAALVTQLPKIKAVLLLCDFVGS